MPLWTNNGNLVGDGNGNLIVCDTCPCGGISGCPPTSSPITLVNSGINANNLNNCIFISSCYFAWEYFSFVPVYTATLAYSGGQWIAGNNPGNCDSDTSLTTGYYASLNISGYPCFDTPTVYTGIVFVVQCSLNSWSVLIQANENIFYASGTGSLPKGVPIANTLSYGGTVTLDW